MFHTPDVLFHSLLFSFFSFRLNVEIDKITALPTPTKQSVQHEAHITVKAIPVEKHPHIF